MFAFGQRPTTTMTTSGRREDSRHEFRRRTRRPPCATHIRLLRISRELAPLVGFAKSTEQLCVFFNFDRDGRVHARGEC